MTLWPNPFPDMTVLWQFEQGPP